MEVDSPLEGHAPRSTKLVFLHVCLGEGATEVSDSILPKRCLELWGSQAPGAALAPREAVPAMRKEKERPNKETQRDKTIKEQGRYLGAPGIAARNKN